MKHAPRTRPWVYPLLAVLLLCQLATPAHSQNLGDLLSGKTAPLQIRMKEMDGGDWRRFTISEPGDTGGLSGLLTLMAMGRGGGTPNLTGIPYYTRGRTVQTGDQTYLVAYRVDPATYLTPKLLEEADGILAPPKTTPETVLTLSLLNLRTMGHIQDVKAFDVKTELAENAAAESRQNLARSNINLKQISTGLLMYMQDYDEVIPPMGQAITGEKVLNPYIKNEAVFLDPNTRSPYAVNRTLSYYSLAEVMEIVDPAKTVAIYEEAPGPDKVRNVAFLDGSVRKISEDEFPELLRKSTLKVRIAKPPKPPTRPAVKPPAKPVPARRKR